MRRFTAAVAVLLSLACAFSCKKEKGGGDTLEKIYFVDPASASMVLSQGQTGYIMYATVPESAAATAVMEWSSSDTNIAEVFNGQVTALRREIPSSLSNAATSRLPWTCRWCRFRSPTSASRNQ